MAKETKVKGLARALSYLELLDLVRNNVEDETSELIAFSRFVTDVERILSKQDRMIQRNTEAIIYLGLSAAGSKSLYDAFADYFYDQMAELTADITSAMNLVLEKSTPDDYNQFKQGLQNIKTIFENNDDYLTVLKDDALISKETWQGLLSKVRTMEVISGTDMSIKALSWITLGSNVFLNDGGKVLNDNRSGIMTAYKFYCNTEGDKMKFLRGWWRKEDDNSGSGVFFNKTDGNFLFLSKAKDSDILSVKPFISAVEQS